MTSKNLSKLASYLLPGHGYIGSLAINQLEIPINGELDEVDLEIRGRLPSYLNLSSIEFYDINGAIMEPKKYIKDAFLSTTLKSDVRVDVKDVLFKKVMIHSGLEGTPSLVIKLKSPTFISKIAIKNRAGVYGARTRNLVVTAWNGSTQTSRYINSGEGKSVEMLMNLASLVNVTLEDKYESDNAIRVKALLLQKALADAVANSVITLDLKQSYALLPVHDLNPVVNNKTLCFIAAVIASTLKRDKKFQTAHLWDFQQILTNPGRINYASKIARKIVKNELGENVELVVGKHNIGTSTLLEKKAEYLEVMEIVINQMNEWKMSAVLCYGTLLGAVRDKGFIAHDDDVDMLYFDKSVGLDEMRRNREKVIERFKSFGYKVWDSGTNFHVTPKGHSVGIDLFPCFSNGTNTSVMMTNLVFEGVPDDLLLPPSQIDLFGKNFPAPAKPKKWLELKYGKGWVKIDPYYEWPWPLSRLDDWPSRKTEKTTSSKRTSTIAWGQHLGPGKKSPPKNSISLIKEAIRIGFDGVEIDTRISLDNEFIMSQSDFVEGPQGQKMKISQASAKQIQKVQIGKFKGKPESVATLKAGLKLLKSKGKCIHIDPQFGNEHYAALRKLTNSVKFNPSKIVLSGHSFSALAMLLQHFPESTLLYKFAAHFSSIDELILDELKARKVDGLMLFWPLHHEDISEIMLKLKARNLQVLFYCHGGWPDRGEPDVNEKSFEKMVEANSDFVMTTASDTEAFKSLIRKPL